MSIIHEALKKVQVNLGHSEKKTAPKEPTENFSKNLSQIYDKLHQGEDKKPAAGKSIPEDTKKQTPASSVPERTPDPKPKASSKSILTFFLFVFIAVAIVILLQLALFQKISTSTVTRTPTARPIPNQIFKSPISRNPLSTQKSSQILVLKGISMIDKNKKVALINDAIYEVGDMVQNKKVVAITLDKVDLQDKKGEITSLRVQAAP